MSSLYLEYTIDLILKRIYDNGELSTNITRSEMKEMLTRCTKNVHFTFNGDIYVQTDGVAMGSPLSPGHYTLVPILKDQLSFWKRYVDDTITFIKIGSAEYVLLILNSFHPNIEFTYETELNSKLVFSDVLLLREGQNVVTTVYRKVTNSDIYLNWNLFCPQSWKRGTLKSLVQRAHLIGSTEDLLKTELNHIQKVLLEINDFPLWVIKQIFPEEEQKYKHQNIEDNDSNVRNTKSGNKHHLFVLHYQGEQGSRLVKSLK